MTIPPLAVSLESLSLKLEPRSARSGLEAPASTVPPVTTTG